MKRIIGSFVAVFALVVITGCGSTPKVKDVSGTTEILEHKGTRWGVAQPSWVTTVMTTPNQKTLSKELGIDKHIWVLESSGENLDFLQNWVDQVDARAEIAASIKQGIADFVKADMKGESKESVDKELERYSARAAMISLSGLNKEIEWWTKTRSRLDKKSDYEIQYNYLVVYSLDEKLYEKQIMEAFKDLGDEERTQKLFEKLNGLVEIRVKN